MNEIVDKSKCCGCWACANVCPKHCIIMEEDQEGFRYPRADENVCIKCGLCEKVCPLKDANNGNDVIENYIIQHKDSEIRKKSTSGGFFTAACRYAIEHGGVVFGAAFDSQMTLRHMYAETMDDCAKFRGSKYVQSLIGNAYKEAKIFLEQGRFVVFSGTPCQIAGLKKYLGNAKCENLVTIDVVCHGTPSPKLFDRFLAHQSLCYGNTKPVAYLSRDKHYGFSYSTSSIFFENGRKYHKGIDSDLMLGLYFRNLVSRPSCYKCQFKSLERVSDLTIFDCWDAPKENAIFDRDGATNVFVHTKQGVDFFEKIKVDFVYAQADLEKIIARDGVMIRNQVPENPLRTEFFNDLNSGMGIPLIEKKYMHRSLLKKVLSFIKPFMFKIGVFDLYLRMKK